MSLSNLLDKSNIKGFPVWNLEREEKQSNGELPLTIKVRLYKGTDLIREDVFDQQCLTIGSGNKADLVLTGRDIADIHANVYAENKQLFIFGPPTEQALTVNERAAKAAVLKPKDSVGIGSYRLTFKLEPQNGHATDNRRKFEKKNNGYNGNGNGNKNLKLDLKSRFKDLLSSKGASIDDKATPGSDYDDLTDLDLRVKLQVQSGDSGTVNQDDIPFRVVFKGQFKDGREPVKVVRQLKRRFKLQEVVVKELDILLLELEFFPIIFIQ